MSQSPTQYTLLDRYINESVHVTSAHPEKHVPAHAKYGLSVLSLLTTWFLIVQHSHVVLAYWITNLSCSRGLAAAQSTRKLFTIKKWVILVFDSQSQVYNLAVLHGLPSEN